jgi:hypothetical protein
MDSDPFIRCPGNFQTEIPIAIHQMCIILLVPTGESILKGFTPDPNRVDRCLFNKAQHMRDVVAIRLPGKREIWKKAVVDTFPH